MIELELRGGVWARRPTRQERRAGRALKDAAWEREFSRWGRRVFAAVVVYCALGAYACAFAMATGEPLLEFAVPGDIAIMVLLLFGPWRQLVR